MTIWLQGGRLWNKIVIAQKKLLTKIFYYMDDFPNIDPLKQPKGLIDIWTDACMEKNPNAFNKKEELRILMDKDFGENVTKRDYRVNLILENINTWNEQYKNIPENVFLASVNSSVKTLNGTLVILINPDTDMVKFRWDGKR
jgi:hypothetical protein